MESVFFDIHCSKLKPDPFGDLGEASDECVSHTMLFFSIGEAALDRFFSFVIKLFHAVCMPYVFDLFQITEPDMLSYCLFTFSILCAFAFVRTVFADISFAFVLSVSFSVCSCII